MTNKIMELADEYAMSFATQNACDWEPHQATLATEVKAHIDYTRAVVNERDAYKTSLEATKGEVYRLLSERDALRKANLDCVDHFNAIQDDYERLRKAAQMALDALDFLDIDDEIPNGAVEALRKELGQ